MADSRPQRRFAVIQASDVVGYSRLMHADEAGTLERLKRLRAELFDAKLAEYGGRIFKTTGDGVLAEFGSAVDAVQHAIDVQRALGERAADDPEDRRIQLRIGINVGDVIVEGDDLFGDGINIASRLEGLAEPGAICLSSAVYETVRNKLDVGFDDLGEQSLRNIADPVHAYQIAAGMGDDGGSVAATTAAIFRRPAVAVLPFENLGGDPEQDYFADGLTEDIITALSMWRSFPVIARASTFAYKGKTPDIRTVGRELGARYVIEGSVRKAGNRVRVTAQLINAETGHHVWAERYDRDLEDIFELQDQLTQQIAATLTPELERTEHAHAVATKPRNLNAWDCYQRGWALLKEFRPQANTQAYDMFRKALELDPAYSRAYTGLACASIRDLMSLSPGQRRKKVAEAIAAGQRAVELDPSDSEAHQYLGIAFIWAGDFDQAIAEEERAIQLNPSNYGAHVSIGHQLTLSGRPEEGIPYLEKGIALSPQDARGPLFQSFMARSHLFARHYAEAADWARRAVRTRPDQAETQLLLASCLGHVGEIDPARKALQECERLTPGFSTAIEHWRPVKSKAVLEHFLDGLRKAGWQG